MAWMFLPFQGALYKSIAMDLKRWNVQIERLFNSDQLG
jgi:hypothetical protein